MPRLIDADALEADLKRQYVEVFGEARKTVKPEDFFIERRAAYHAELVKAEQEEFFEYLRTRQTIDPESLRPHGWWVQNGQCEHKPGRIKNTDHWTTYKCSVCGASNGRWKRHNYCHNCGAKMDEEEV